MEYTPNTWQARQGAGLNRFQDQDGNVYYFTAFPEQVTQPGTPFSADWMNHLEQGIAGLYAAAGAASGVATLDENAKLTPSQIPGTVVTSDETAAGAADARTGPLQMGKVLWTGTWNTGTLEVPGISKYNLIGFRIYDNFAMLFAANYNGNLRGIGGSSWASGTASHYFINCTLSGDTLTMVAANGQTINGSGDGNAIASIRPITGIVGLL